MNDRSTLAALLNQIHAGSGVYFDEKGVHYPPVQAKDIIEKAT